MLVVRVRSQGVSEAMGDRGMIAMMSHFLVTRRSLCHLATIYCRSYLAILRKGVAGRTNWAMVWQYLCILYNYGSVDRDPTYEI